MAAHLIAHPLTVFLRHLPALALFAAHLLAIGLRRLPPLFAHFLTHLAALVGRYLGMRRPGDNRPGCQHEQQAHYPSPDQHPYSFPSLHASIVASLCRHFAQTHPRLCNNLFPPSPLKKLVTITRMPTMTAGLSFAP
jgi:membrane-associated phospholipid phosphatase